MSDMKLQAGVEMSTEGAEAALARVGDKAGQMANRLQTEAGKAGKAVDGIGSSATESAEKFTRGENRISESIKRTTRNLQELGKTASQKIELRIAERGLDPAKFEPMLVKLRELEAVQNRVAASSPKMGSGLQNTSYQLQDFIVQVNGGTDATRALSQQLPQMLIGFGAAGAAIGVVAALLPNLISMFGGAAGESKKFSDAVGDFDSGSQFEHHDTDQRRHDAEEQVQDASHVGAPDGCRFVASRHRALEQVLSRHRAETNRHPRSQPVHPAGCTRVAQVTLTFNGKQAERLGDIGGTRSFN
jgi:ABC-type transporter Mla subunit MlaD